MVLLVVGDDVLARDGVVSALRSFGCRVVTARTGLDAINQALLAAPTMIVVLEGARAWETIEQLRSRMHTRSVPLLGSCHLSREQEATAKELGVVLVAAGDLDGLLDAVRGMSDR